MYWWCYWNECVLEIILVFIFFKWYWEWEFFENVDNREIKKKDIIEICLGECNNLSVGDVFNC